VSESINARWAWVDTDLFNEWFGDAGAQIIQELPSAASSGRGGPAGGAAEQHSASAQAAEGLNEDRQEVFGFARGHRVRVKAPGAHHGYTGVVDWVGGCSITADDASEFYSQKVINCCRDICPNVRFAVTHRTNDDGSFHPDPIGGHMVCPAGDLEHCD
jgi:hypothetical protein